MGTDGGGRFDSYESTSDYVGTVTEVDQNNFSYRIGGMYEFDSGWSPYINYATSFEPNLPVLIPMAMHLIHQSVNKSKGV